MVREVLSSFHKGFSLYKTLFWNQELLSKPRCYSFECIVLNDGLLSLSGSSGKIVKGDTANIFATQTFLF